MPSPKKQAPTEDKSLQPASRPLETLAPDLGLGPTTSVQNVRDALEALLDRARKIELPPETKKAFDTVDGAYRPPAPGYLPFDAQIVPLGGSSIRNVKEAIAVLRRAVEVASVQVTEPSRAEGTAPARQEDFSSLRFPRQAVERRGKMPYQHHEPAHISGPIGEVLAKASNPSQTQEPEVVAQLREALQYLVRHGVIPPTAHKDQKPSPETQAALARHGIELKWKADEPPKKKNEDKTAGAYHPFLMAKGAQSLLTASMYYFNIVRQHYEESSYSPSKAKRDLIRECIKARTLEDGPPTKRDANDRLRVLCSEEITGRPASAAAMIRWEALYRFLKATNAFHDTH